MNIYTDKDDSSIFMIEKDENFNDIDMTDEYNYRTAFPVKKYTIEDMQQLARKVGLEKTGSPGECLSEKYINMRTPLKWKCGKCHYEWIREPKDLKYRRQWCKRCAASKNALKYSLGDMYKLARDIGIKTTEFEGKCLSEEYFDAATKLLWQCGKCGNVFEKSPSNVMREQWCPRCTGIPYYDIQDMKKLAYDVGLEKTGHPGKCLSDEYINMRTPLKWQCGKCENVWETEPRHIKYSQHWCPKCAEESRIDWRREHQSDITIEDMKKLAYDIGLEKTGHPGKCLSENYISDIIKLEWFCGKCGNIWKAVPNSIKKGTWCPSCSQGYHERVCRKFFVNIFRVQFPSSRPKWLVNPLTGRGMHLDGFNKFLNLAFEYDGIQHFEFIPGWHKTYQAFFDYKSRDYFKKKECEEHNIYLIIVPYWIEPAEMQDYIIKEYKRLTGIDIRKIYKQKTGKEMPNFNHKLFFIPETLDKYLKNKL